MTATLTTNDSIRTRPRPRRPARCGARAPSPASPPPSRRPVSPPSPMRSACRSKVGGESIPLVGFAQLTLFFSVIGTVIAGVLARRSSQAHRTFVTTTLVLTALSFVPDVLADAQTSTKVTLVLTHVVAAAIVIPALASRLAD